MSVLDGSVFEDTAISGPAERRASLFAVRELEVRAPQGEPVPHVVLVDASAAARVGTRPADAQELALRDWSKEFSAQAGATHSSRSYRLPLALLAWHSAPVGVDIERLTRCDDAFAESIQTPRERDTLRVQGDRHLHFTSLWSGKEALSKALGDALAYDPRRLEGPLGWPDGRSGPWRAAPLEVDSGHVAWACWRNA
jgi:hypothetical protein